MSSTFQNCALLLVGHGSTVNPDSATPTHQHADNIRRQGIFHEVQCVFWKEEPSLAEAFYTIKAKEVFVVPNFISEGYFCQQVIPRELKLEGKITERDGKRFYYCDPVGIHKSMSKLLIKRADEIAPGIPRTEISLIIVGHGTNLNDNSRKAIEDQVVFIREQYDFAQVLDAYMEEEPLVQNWHSMATAPHVVVVPFFIADGLHSYQDIPVLLGIESEPTAAASQNEVFRCNPYHLQEKQLFYTGAIGTEELMSEVILDQVRDFEAQEKPEHFALETAYTWTPPSDRFVIGEIKVSKNQDSWLLHHVKDDPKFLQVASEDPAFAREIATYDANDEFRPIKTAHNLKQHWLLQMNSDADLELALDFFYPGAIGFYEHFKAGTLKPVPMRETLGRQTGMYRFANQITDEQAEELALESSKASGRRILWPLTEGLPFAKLQGNAPALDLQDQIPLLSIEADTHVVNRAREVSKANAQAAQKL